MSFFPRSLEGFRLCLFVLALSFPGLAAFMIFLQVGSGILLLSLSLLSALLLFLGLSFGSAVASLLRTNVQCAQDMVTGNYGSDFADNNFSGLLGRNQSALRDMLVHFKHELSLSRGVMHGMVTPCVVTDLNEVFIFGNPALITMLECYVSRYLNLKS